MPYSISKDTSVCPASKPHAVKNANTGKLVPGGCHATHDKALKHQRALQANVTAADQRQVTRGLYEHASQEQRK